MSEHGVDVHALTDDQLGSLRRDVLHTIGLRKQIGTSPEKIEEAIDAYQRESGKGEGEPWEPPLRATDSYRLDALVTLDGELWRSLIPHNPHKPGAAGWRLEPTLDEDGNEIPPPYVVPSGAHDSYQQGERVTFDGEVYAAARDGVVHNPTEYPADWAHIVPAIPIEPAPEPESEPEPPDDEEPVEPEPEPEPEPDGTIDNPLTWSGDAVDYQTDQYVTHDGVLYRVQQAHESAAHWPPDEVASLYERQS